jgi:FixJ family two-component response regulator
MRRRAPLRGKHTEDSSIVRFSFDQDALVARRQQVPIIFITAYPEERFEMRARANGAAGILVKPFDEQSLADCLMEVLRKE